MKKLLLVIARYNDPEQQIFEEYFSPRNKLFAKKHNYIYKVIDNSFNLQLIRNNPTWWKFSVIRDLINTNQLENGDILTHIDADIYFAKLDYDIATPKSFSYCIDSGNTHCMGWYSIKINSWTRKLLENILSEERYLKLGNKLTVHDRFKDISSFWEIFREQASWYSLAGIKRHSDEPFWNLPNYGFHSEMNDDVVYSLEELNEHVHIYPTPYNVTEWPGESGCDFNINKLNNKDEVIVRHFVSGQWKHPNIIQNWL